ncbi:MAG: hypothetical protein ACRDF7_05560 [Candidatus Limnocylindrales bacterium]
MSLKLYHPVPGGLEPRPPEGGDWRKRLRSPRWHVARLANPEAQDPSPALAVMFFGGLATATFVLLVLGYATGFWK